MAKNKSSLSVDDMNEQAYELLQQLETFDISAIKDIVLPRSKAAGNKKLTVGERYLELYEMRNKELNNIQANKSELELFILSLQATLNLLNNAVRLSQNLNAFSDVEEKKRMTSLFAPEATITFNSPETVLLPSAKEALQSGVALAFATLEQVDQKHEDNDVEYKSNWEIRKKDVSQLNIVSNALSNVNAVLKDTSRGNIVNCVSSLVELEKIDNSNSKLNFIGKLCKYCGMALNLLTIPIAHFVPPLSMLSVMLGGRLVNYGSTMVEHARRKEVHTDMLSGNLKKLLNQSNLLLSDKKISTIPSVQEVMTTYKNDPEAYKNFMVLAATATKTA